MHVHSTVISNFKLLFHFIKDLGSGDEGRGATNLRIAQVADSSYATANE